jgi:hypothetical protein
MPNSNILTVKMIIFNVKLWKKWRRFDLVRVVENLIYKCKWIGQEGQDHYPILPIDGVRERKTWVV